ncbi:MAG: exo-alpha-sialidase, partial [Bacteroidales bacterium]|nr:exo-alpha-sialidase [Bacteroidales bacterium]
VITAKDGSIVAVTDKRKYNQGDLPEDIDIVCRRSTDGGHTWSEPYTIAQGTGYNHGFGDCVLAWTNDDNGLIAGFVGGVGLWNSTPSNPIRSYIARSYDNGQTWTEPEDITDFIFGSNCVVPEHRTWRASFFGSGNGLITSTGRIMFVAAIRETTAQSLSNYAVYSDDNGITWHVSGRASVSGDEAKVTELVDGRILMSIRHNGKRWYNISNDGGETWQSSTSTWNDITAPACNGDMIRYTSVNQGFNKNRLLHSVPFGSSRTDVSVYISYDEGETWPVRKCIVPYSSAYSSLCVLPDGTIGLYVEEEYPGNSGYSTVFYNFSLEWLTDGADSLDPTFIAENEQQRPSIDVYPVPATSCIVFNEAVKNVEIFDVTGKLVIYKQIAATEKPLVDVSDLDKGLYFVVCVDANGVLRNGRFIK